MKSNALSLLSILELVDIGQADVFFKHLHSQGLRAELVKLKSEDHFGVVDSIGRDNSPTDMWELA